MGSEMCIRDRPAPRDGTFREVITALGMPANRVEEMGVLNSFKVDDRITRGTLIKVVSR